MGRGHWQLDVIKWRAYTDADTGKCETYHGNLRSWFADLMRPTKAEPLKQCWRQRDGTSFCAGRAILYEIVLNIPITLIIDIHETDKGHHWDIPGFLHPLSSNPAVTAHGVKYSITSHVYFNTSLRHYIARYSSLRGGKVRIFDYDGMKHEGHAIRNRQASTLKGFLTGPTNELRDIPVGYVLTAVVYHLDGGESAQKYFRSEQIRLATKLGLHFNIPRESNTGIPSSCELRGPHIETVPDVDRSLWLPFGSSSVDYRDSRPGRKPAAKSRHPRSSAATSDSDSSSSLDEEEADEREVSIPPIATIPLSALHTHDEDGILSCHPCNTTGSLDDPSEAVQCWKCGLWSHIACVRPLAPPPSESESESDSESSSEKSSVISWHDRRFRYKCIVCTAREDTPTCDPQCVLF